MLPKSTHLGPYEILAPIGAGGMGVVYRARDSRLDREVAITGVQISGNPFLPVLNLQVMMAAWSESANRVGPSGS
jgi:serine/threonine protein kinase